MRKRTLGGVLALMAMLALAPQPARAGVAVDADLSHAALTGDPQTPVGGNPQGDVTIVAFFDYNCAVCMRVQPVIETLTRTDPGIRLVYKDWPIFGAGSIAAARIALATRWQDRYQAVHDALLDAPVRKVEADQIRAIAVKAGADAARLDADLRTHRPEIDAVLARTEKQADKLGARGTPLFLIGPYLVDGGLDLDGFRKVVAQARIKQGQPSP